MPKSTPVSIGRFDVRPPPLNSGSNPSHFVQVFRFLPLTYTLAFWTPAFFKKLVSLYDSVTSCNLIKLLSRYTLGLMVGEVVNIGYSPFGFIGDQ